MLTYSIAFLKISIRMRAPAILISVRDLLKGRDREKYLCMTISAVSNCPPPSLLTTLFLSLKRSAIIKIVKATQRKEEEYLLHLDKGKNFLCLDTKGATLEDWQVDYCWQGEQTLLLNRGNGFRHYLKVVRSVANISSVLHFCDLCVMYCTVISCCDLCVMYCTALYCAVLYCCELCAMHCTVLHCCELCVIYCTALHCTVLL
jgi:hypothetical protein